MENKYILFGMFLLLTTILFFYKYKIEGLRIIAAKFIIAAEEFHKSEEGKQKLKLVITSLREILPFYLRWIVSEKLLTNIIEDTLIALQSQFKTSIDKQLTIVNTALKLTGETSNELKMSLTKMEQEITSRGYVEGFINTNFKDETLVGIKAGIKF